MSGRDPAAEFGRNSGGLSFGANLTKASNCESTIFLGMSIGAVEVIELVTEYVGATMICIARQPSGDREATRIAGNSVKSIRRLR